MCLHIINYQVQTSVHDDEGCHRVRERATMLLFSGAKQNAVRWLPFDDYGVRYVAITGSWDDEGGKSKLAAWNLEPGVTAGRKLGKDACHDGGVTGIAIARLSTTSVQAVTASDIGGLASYKLAVSDNGGGVEVNISSAQWTAGGMHAGGAATAVVIFPQEQSVAASTGEDGRIVVLSALSGQALRAVHAEEDTISSLAATGSYMLASAGRSVLLWDARDLQGASQIALGEADAANVAGRFTSVCFDPTGRLVAAGSSGSVLSVYDVRKANARLCHLPLPHSANMPLCELAFPPAGAGLRNILLSASASGLLQWDFAATANTADNFHHLKNVHVLADSALTVNSLDPHPTEHQAVCVADDDSIQLARYVI